MMFESSAVSCRSVKIVLKPVAVSHILRHPVIEEYLLLNPTLRSMLPLDLYKCGGKGSAVLI